MKTTLTMLSIALLPAVVVAAPAGAQGRVFFGVGGQISVPTANTKDFAGGTSWRGVSFDLRREVGPRATVGVAAGWHVFDERTDELLSFRGLDASGDQLRHINSFPLLASAHYYLGEAGRVRPFVGANVGGYLMEHRLEIGVTRVAETNFHFGFAPELGLAVPLQPTAYLCLSGRYHHALAAGSVDDQSYFGVVLGYVWSNW